MLPISDKPAGNWTHSSFFPRSVASRVQKWKKKKERKKERKRERKKERKQEKDGWNGASARPLATSALQGVKVLHQINRQDCNHC